MKTYWFGNLLAAILLNEDSTPWSEPESEQEFGVVLNACCSWEE